MPQAFHGKLNVRHAQPWIRFSGIQLDRVVLRRTGFPPKSTHIPDVNFFRLPWEQPFLNLFRKTIGISRRAKRLAGKNRRSLMMTVPVTISARKTSDQNVGLEHTNHPHHVPERNIVTLPFPKGFFSTFGKAKIRNPRETLFDAVVPAR